MASTILTRMNQGRKLEAGGLAFGAVTVTQILNDGAGAEPFRALGRLPNGEQLMIASRVPLRCQAGDDIHAYGWFQPGSKTIPHELFIGEPTPAHNRLRGMLQSGAELRSFGKGKGRPALITYAKMGQDGVGLKLQRGQSGALVVEALTQSADPTIDWALKLLSGINGDGLTILIDPSVLPPLPYAQRGQAAALKRWVEKAVPMVAGQAPAAIWQQLDPNSLLQTIAIGAHQMPVNQGRRPHDSRLSIVMPFNQFEIAHDCWGGLSMLGGPPFAPKKLVDPEIIRMHATVHELGHSIQYQRKIGRAYSFSESDANMAECFADSFALLAMAQKGVDMEELKTIAEWRYSSFVAYGNSHATGPACDAVLARAEALKESGQLEKLTPKQLMDEAEGIARSHAISPDMMDEIKRLCRQFVFERLTDKYGQLEGFGLPIEDSWRMLRELHRSTDPAYKDIKPYIKRTLDAIRSTAWSPDELKKPGMLEKAIETFRTDLSTSLSRIEDVRRKKALIEQVQANLTGRNLFDAVPDDLEDDYEDDEMGRTRSRGDSRRSRPGESVPESMLSKALRAGYIRVAAEAARETAMLPDRRRAPNLDAQPAVLTIRQSWRDDRLAAVFALDPLQRLNAYRATLTREVALLGEQKQIASEDGLNTLNDLARQRQDLAFGLRADARAWALVEDAGGEALAKHLRQISCRQPRLYEVERLDQAHRFWAKRVDALLSPPKGPDAAAKPGRKPGR